MCPKFCWTKMAVFFLLSQSLSCAHTVPPWRPRLLAPAALCLSATSVFPPCAICPSTLAYQETINRTICGLVTSPCYSSKPNNDKLRKKQKEHRVSDSVVPPSASIQTETRPRKILFDFSAFMRAFNRLCVDWDRRQQEIKKDIMNFLV